MNKFYHVSTNELPIKNKKGILDISIDQVKQALAVDPDQDPSPKDKFILLKTRKDAVDYAASAHAEKGLKDKSDFLIVECELVNQRKYKDNTYELDGGTEIVGIEVPRSNIKFLSASLKHADKGFKNISLDDVDLTDLTPAKAAKKSKRKDKKDKDETEDKATTYTDMLKNSALPAAGVLVTGGAFWFSGMAPAGLGLLANLGLPLAATSVAAQVGLAAVVGVAAVAAVYAAKAVVNYAYNWYSDWRKTAKDRYKEEKTATKEEIEKLKEDLGYEDDNQIVEKYSKVLENAEKPTFGEDGSLTKEPKLNKVKVLSHYRDALASIAAAKEGSKRDKVEEKVLNTKVKFK